MATFEKDLEPNAARIFEAVPKYLAETLSIVDTKEIDRTWASRLYRDNRGDRIYPSEFVVISVDGRLFLIAESPHSNIEPRPTAMLYFWNNYLWPTYSLTCYWEISNLQRAVSFRSFFMTGTKELDLFRQQPTRIIILRGQKCISAVDLNIKQVDAEMWKLLDQRPPHQSLHEGTGAKVLVASYLEKDATPERELEYGWAQKLDAHAREAIRYLSREEGAVQEHEVVKSSPFAEAFERDDDAALELYDAHRQLFWEKHHSPVAVLQCIRETLAEAPIHQTFIELIVTCAWFSAEGTNRGRELPSVDPTGTVSRVILTTAIQKEFCNVFWSRHSLTLPLYYKELFGNGNIGIEFAVAVKSFPPYRGAIEAGEEFVGNVFAEAVSLKQWTIPFGAYVQLEAGEIVSAKLHEIGSEVACLLLNKDGEHLLVWIEPSSGNMSISGILEISNEAGLQGHDTQWLQRFELGIKILLAAMIRDFWVVEERERVFGVATDIKKQTRIRADYNKPILVYLPRVRYVGDVQNKGDGLNYVARRAHFVIGHLRKAVRASETQIALARRFAVIVPEGFTFVRPHKRGEKAEERIYRSRSALQCIDALESCTVTGKDRWFQYEINVQNWLKANGFEVVHLAANRSGDGGIDIQASRNDENLLVQCKYWQKERIGPRIIREMLGTLQTFPQGARGVIITSTELTTGAKRLAIDYGLQFIERADFSDALPSNL